jgi:hypothetical protein
MFLIIFILITIISFTKGFTSAPSRVGAAAVGLKILRSNSLRNDVVCRLSGHLTKDVSTAPGAEFSPSNVEIFDNENNAFGRNMVTGSNTDLTVTADEASEGDSCYTEYSPSTGLSISNRFSKERSLVSLPAEEQEQQRPSSSSIAFGSSHTLRLDEDSRDKHRNECPRGHGMDSDTVAAVAVTKVKQNIGIGRASRNTYSSLASLPAPIPRPAEFFSAQNSDLKRKTNSFSSFSRKTEDNGDNPCEITRMTNHDFLKQPKARINGSEQCNDSITHPCSVTTTILKNNFRDEDYSLDNFFSIKRIKDKKDLT